MMKVTIKVNKAGLDNIKKKINTLKTDITDKSFFTNVGNDVVRTAQTYAPFYTGDTFRNISMVLATKKQVRIQSTSTDPTFDDKHLWINAVPGHERSAHHGLTYAEVAKTGHPDGYWNVAFKQSVNTVGDNIVGRIARIINS